MHAARTAKRVNEKNMSPHAIHWEFDPQAKCYLQIDKAIVTLTGYSQEEWKTKEFRETHIHEDDKNWALSIPENETFFEKEYRLHTKNGSIIWLRDITKTTITAHGKSIHQGHFSNITDQKSVENAMQMLAGNVADNDNDLFFHECVKNIATVYSAKYAFIGLLNKNSIKTLAVWANGELADNFEYDLKHTPCKDILCMAKELIPTNVTKLYPKDELLIQMGVDSYFGTPLTPVEQEMTGLLAVLDDKPMSLTSWTAPVLSLFANRITVELQKREQHQSLLIMIEKAQAANRAKSDFLANMSHELRTPMHAILAFSNSGIRNINSSPIDKLHTYFKHINKSADKLMLLLNNLLDLANFESGELDLNFISCDLHQLTLQSIQMLQDKASEKNITVETQNNMKCNCYFDQDLIAQVINNLLSNAINFSSSNSVITISLTQNEVIGFKVSDAGLGIPNEELKTIFESFTQSSRSNTGSGGKGLGLSISKKIIIAHKGNIWAKNNLTTGTTFQFSLPILSSNSFST